MTGYQEVLTDPSYAGQIVTMTCPEIGNYGVTDEDVESRGIQVAGFIIRSESPIASNWRAEGTLRDYLIRNNVVAISDIDTRALTQAPALVGRDAGCRRDGPAGSGRARRHARAASRRWKAPISSRMSPATTPFDFVPPTERRVRVPGERKTTRRLRIAAYDFGMKWNILRRFAAHGCDVRVYPATTPAVDAARRRSPTACS